MKKTYPAYFMSKNKIQLTPTTDVDGILAKFAEKFKNEQVTTKEIIRKKVTYRQIRKAFRSLFIP